MQFWFIINVGNLWYFFQDSLINTNKKAQHWFKIFTLHVEKLEVSIFFLKNLVFIQQIFAILIETVIVKIDIVRKHLYFE